MLCGLSFVEPLFDRWADWYLKNMDFVASRFCYYGTRIGGLCSLLYIGNGHRYIFLLTEMTVTIAFGYGIGLLLFLSLTLIPVFREIMKKAVVTGLISTVVILVTLYD